MVRATPKNGGGEWWPLGWPIYPFPVAHQRQKTWGRSHHFLPLQVRRHNAPCEGGHARRSLVSPRRSRRGESAPTLVQCGFPGTAWTTTARASPSEREALWWSKACATWCATSVRHPLFVNGPPLRRHVLDPRRRKSSIISRPFEAGFSCSHWTTFSMTTSRPLWCSTVSQS